LVGLWSPCCLCANRDAAANAPRRWAPHASQVSVPRVRPNFHTLLRESRTLFRFPRVVPFLPQTRAFLMCSVCTACFVAGFTSAYLVCIPKGRSHPAPLWTRRLPISRQVWPRDPSDCARAPFVLIFRCILWGPAFADTSLLRAVDSPAPTASGILPLCPLFHHRSPPILYCSPTKHGVSVSTALPEGGAGGCFEDCAGPGLGPGLGVQALTRTA